MLQNLDTFAFLIYAFLLLFAAMAIFAFFKRLLFVNKRIYKAKGPYLLSPGENKFFDALTKVLDSNFYICPKVRIADLVEVDLPENSKDFWKSFNKISQKHVDFVICNRSDFSPKLIIELDGGSHNDRSKTLRDALVDKVFKDADIPILHIKPSGFYEYKTLREQISHSIKNEVASTHSP